MLTDRQLERYREDGYVVPDYRLSDETLQDIRRAYDELLERHPEFSDYCPTVLAYARDFLQYACNDDILDMVCQVLGDDIALWNSSFFAKPARVGTRTPWHQDGEYWPMRPLATCTVWMAIDDATLDNGCLEVIRGSHKDQRLKRHRTNNGPGLALNQELRESEYDAAQAVPLVLQAGQISLHDVYLVHGSEPNRSDKPRRGMTLRFMPTTSLYDRELERELHQRSNLNVVQRRPVYLMRGIDKHGANDFLPLPSVAMATSS